METKKRKRETLTDPLRTPPRDDEDDNPSTPPPPPPATRDWAALPEALLFAIFGRLRHVDILLGAELTCAPWRRIAAGEPALWRRIDVGRDGPEARADAESLKLGAWMAMARAAVERSAGQCESYRGPVGPGFLAYLAASSPVLRRLHITSFFHLPGKEFAERAAAFPSFPVLEGLVLSHDAFRLYMYGPIGVEMRMRLGKMVSNLKIPKK